MLLWVTRVNAINIRNQQNLVHSQSTCKVGGDGVRCYIPRILQRILAQQEIGWQENWQLARSQEHFPLLQACYGNELGVKSDSNKPYWSMPKIAILCDALQDKRKSLVQTPHNISEFAAARHNHKFMLLGDLA